MIDTFVYLASRPQEHAHFQCLTYSNTQDAVKFFIGQAPDGPPRGAPRPRRAPRRRPAGRWIPRRDRANRRAGLQPVEVSLKRYKGMFAIFKDNKLWEAVSDYDLFKEYLHRLDSRMY